MPKVGDDREVPMRLNYPVSEAAVLLGISDTTAWRRVDDGLLRTVYDGGRRLVPHEALEEYRQNLPTAVTRRRKRATSPAA